MSGVRIVREQERLCKIVDEAKFYYRRMPVHIRGSIIERFTSKRSGNTNWHKASTAFLEHCILDWENVYEVIDGKRKDLAYEKTLVGCLPEETQGALLEELEKNVDEIEDDIKNSKATRSSKPSTTD